jgi:hypothetical protein
MTRWRLASLFLVIAIGLLFWWRSAEHGEAFPTQSLDTTTTITDTESSPVANEQDADRTHRVSAPSEADASASPVLVDPLPVTAQSAEVSPTVKVLVIKPASAPSSTLAQTKPAVPGLANPAASILPRRVSNLDDPALPGRAVPAAQAPPRELRIMWDGKMLYDTTITIAPGDDLRRPASVVTTDRNGTVLAQYQGTAFVDADGNTQIDGRRATITGAQAHYWSPDSFKITPDAQVTTIDDVGQRRTGSAEPVATN